MSDSKAEKVETLAKVNFALAWKERFRIWKERSTRVAVAEAAGVDVATISLLTNEGPGDRAAMLDAYQQLKVSKVLGVSPAWLAFGMGAKDTETAELGLKLGAVLDQNPALAELMKLHETATAKDRGIMDLIITMLVERIRIETGLHPSPDVKPGVDVAVSGEPSAMPIEGKADSDGAPNASRLPAGSTHGSAPQTPALAKAKDRTRAVLPASAGGTFGANAPGSKAHPASPAEKKTRSPETAPKGKAQRQARASRPSHKR